MPFESVVNKAEVTTGDALMLRLLTAAWNSSMNNRHGAIVAAPASNGIFVGDRLAEALAQVGGRRRRFVGLHGVSRLGSTTRARALERAVLLDALNLTSQRLHRKFFYLPFLVETRRRPRAGRPLDGRLPRRSTSAWSSASHPANAAPRHLPSRAAAQADIASARLDPAHFAHKPSPTRGERPTAAYASRAALLRSSAPGRS